MNRVIVSDSFSNPSLKLHRSFEKSCIIGINWILVILVFCIFPIRTLAQWNNSTDQNTIVYEGGISKSKIVSGSNFYYVSTFRIVPGGCIPYLYKISFDGHMEWPEGGLMINNINQPSELTSYDIKVDVNDNAIVVFRNESLSQQEQYITINKISPEGEFLWGETGIKFDIVGAMEFKPVLCLNPDSSVTMMTNLYRSNPNKPDFQVALMRYSSDGNGLWGTEVVVGFDIYSASHVGITPDGENGCYVTYLKQYSGDDEIFVRRLNDEGISIWPQDIQISDGDLGPGSEESVSGGINGEIYVAWKNYIGSIGVTKVIVQGIKPDGSKAWNSNPIGMYMDYADCQLDPHIGGQDSDGNLYVFWSDCSSGFTKDDLLGQKISSRGELLWGSGGKRIVLDGQCIFMASQIHNDTIYLCYKDPIFNNDAYQAVNLVAVTTNGNAAWSNPTVINTERTSKAYLSMSQILNEQGVICFESREIRSNSYGQIKIQNFWTDGSIGSRNTSISGFVDEDNNVIIWYNDQLKAIEIAGHTVLKSYSVIDLYGRIVKSCDLNYSTTDQLTIPCHNLHSGVYFVRVTDGIEFYSGKVIVP